MSVIFNTMRPLLLASLLLSVIRSKIRVCKYWSRGCFFFLKALKKKTNRKEKKTNIRGKKLVYVSDLHPFENFGIQILESDIGPLKDNRHLRPKGVLYQLFSSRLSLSALRSFPLTNQQGQTLSHLFPCKVPWQLSVKKVVLYSFYLKGHTVMWTFCSVSKWSRGAFE